MKKLTIVIAAVVMTACASNKPVETPVVDTTPKPSNVLVGPKIAGFKEVEYMQRAEVIEATKECIRARMKPVIQQVPQKTEFGTIMLPAVVICETYIK